MNANDKIVDKIRRLLALSESSNEHEAALAASMARDLILKYAVSQEQIRASGGKTTEDEGPIGQEAFGDYRGKIPDWHTSLMSAMERSFMVDTFYTAGHRLWVVGRPAARAAFIATHNFLVAQIDHLADAGWDRVRGDHRGRVANTWWNAEGERIPNPYARADLAGQARRWKRSFALGAVATVRERLSADVKAIEEKAERAAKPNNVNAPLAIEARQVAIVLRSRYDEAKDWLAKNVKTKRGRSSAGATSHDGYNAGRAAGHALDLNAGKRRGLGAGQ